MSAKPSLRIVNRIVVSSVLFAAIAALGSRAAAQCPADWLPGQGAPGVAGNGTVFASTVWDPDGAGSEAPLAVFGGTFIGAGDLPVNSIAAWNGGSWLALGDGLNAQVRALTVYNGQLVAAAGHNGFGNPGPANGVAAFDGTTWQALGSAGFQNVVWALTVYNGELYAGGLFSSAGGTPVNNIARWNGSTWQPVGAGIANGVLSLTVFNGELIAASGTGVLRWNGSSWLPFGPNLTGGVECFTVYNNELIAGGLFQTNGGGPFETVARWNGASGAWQPLGVQMDDIVFALAEFNGELIAGGVFTHVGIQYTDRMARWNGTSWAPIAPGPGMPVRRCDSLVIYNGQLYAGGAQTRPSGTQAEQVGRWDGKDWNYLGGGFDAIVFDFATYDGELIAGGWFSTAGDVIANGIARRDSAGQWHSMGGVSGGDGYVFDLVVINGVLIASGSFTAIDGVPAPSIAMWDGKAWQPFGNTAVTKMLVDDGDLYACGSFGPNQRVARWNPLTHSWDPIGAFPPNSGIVCLTMFNGDLVAAGIGGIGVNASVWRWDFDNPGLWQPVGQHLGSTLVQALGVYNGELFAGGNIDGAVMRFNGTSWVPLGGGLFPGNESPDEILAVFDMRVYNGNLVVAGAFSYAGEPQYSPGAVAAFHVASWNGNNWQGFGGGTNDAAVTLHEHEGDLIIGGWFDMANDTPNGHWARFGPVCAPGDINHDNVVNAADLLAVINNWGPCPVNGGCPADISPPPNGDGVVNAADLLMVINNWG